MIGIYTKSEVNDNGEWVLEFNLTEESKLILRDYIAIHANDRDISSHGIAGEHSREEARYLFADAMLAARVKK